MKLSYVSVVDMYYLILLKCCRVSTSIMGYVKCYVISTVTCYAMATELWLPETFMITLFVKVVATSHLMAWVENS